MGQCISHDPEAPQGKKGTTALRVSKWPELPGPVLATERSVTLTGGGGLAINILQPRRPLTADGGPGKQQQQQQQLLPASRSQDGRKTVSWASKTRAMSAVLALRQSEMDAGARATALGAAAARAAADSASETHSSSHGEAPGGYGEASGGYGEDRFGKVPAGDSGGNPPGRGGGGCGGTGPADGDDDEDAVQLGCLAAPVELRDFSQFECSSRGSKLGPDDCGEEVEPKAFIQAGPRNNWPRSTRPGAACKPEMAWMERARPPLSWPRAGGAETSSEGQQPPAPAATAAAINVEQRLAVVEEGGGAELCALSRRSSRFSTPCQELDGGGGGGEEWPQEVLAAVARSSQVASRTAAAATAHPQRQWQQAQASAAGVRSMDGAKADYPAAAAGATDCDDEPGGAAAASDPTFACGSGRWASRLAPEAPLRPPSPRLTQQPQQQLQQLPRFVDATAAASPSLERWRHSANGDFPNLHQSRREYSPRPAAAALTDDGTGGFPRHLHRSSTLGSSRTANQLLRQATTNRATAAAAVGEVGGSALTHGSRPACPGSGESASRHHSGDSGGVYDPIMDASFTMLPTEGRRGCVEGRGQEGEEVEAAEAAAAAGSIGRGGGGAGAATDVCLEDAEDDPRDGWYPSDAAGGSGGGGGDGGGVRWTRSRAGKTLVMLRMQQAARRAADEEAAATVERAPLEYLPQTSIRRGTPSPPVRSAAEPTATASLDACDEDPSPFRDGGADPWVVAAAAEGIHPLWMQQTQSQPAQLSPSPPLQPQQPRIAEVAVVDASAAGGGGGSELSPAERMAALHSRRTVSERLVGPRGGVGGSASASGGIGGVATMDAAMYTMPGSTEQLPQWVVQPPPPQQHQQQLSQAHSVPLPLQLPYRPPQHPPPARALTTQSSMGHQARSYFHHMQSRRGCGTTTTSGGGGGGVGGGDGARAAGGGAGPSDSIVRRFTVTGQMPADDLLGDRTMQLYPPPSTNAKASALFSKKPSGKAMFSIRANFNGGAGVSGFTAEPELLTPPSPLRPQLQRVESRRPTADGAVAMGGVLPSPPPPRVVHRMRSRLSTGGGGGGVGGGPSSHDGQLGLIMQQGQQQQQQQQQQQGQLLAQEFLQGGQVAVQKMQPMPRGLAPQQSWPVGGSSYKPYEYGARDGTGNVELVSGSAVFGAGRLSASGAAAPPYAPYSPQPAPLLRAHSHRHSDPYWPTAPPQVAAAPPPQLPLPLPGLLTTEEGCEQVPKGHGPHWKVTKAVSDAESSFKAMVQEIDAQVSAAAGTPPSRPETIRYWPGAAAQAPGTAAASETAGAASAAAAAMAGAAAMAAGAPAANAGVPVQQQHYHDDQQPFISYQSYMLYPTNGP